jgi:GNAT superfamily N-acetyltransferase
MPVLATSTYESPEAAPFVFNITGYTGFEEEILRLRNANRDVQKTREYLDWRYARLSGTPAPRVFWIRSSDNLAVGMASLIFRRYWVNNEPRDLAVLGDISLDQRLRNKGLGRALLKFVSRQLDQFSSRHPGFAIPTPAVERCLDAAGWTTAGHLVPHVFLVDPRDTFAALLRNQLLARGAAAVFSRVLAASLRLSVADGASLQFVDDVDETFDTFWSEYPKENLTLRDMSQATLKWRYFQHPHYRFRVAKLVRAGELTGYLVFEPSAPSDRTCRVHDLIVTRPKDLRCMLALFVRHILSAGGSSTIRVVLCDRHPYARALWKSGFVARRAQAAVFQVRSAEGCFAKRESYVTSGDKDV